MGYKPEWKASTERVEEGAHSYPAFVEFKAVGERGAPDVSARFEMRDGIPEVVDFRITALPNGRAVRTADLNTWQPLENLAINGFRAFAVIKGRELGGKFSLGPQSEVDDWGIVGELQTARSRRRGPSDAELEEVARVYRGAVNGRPTEAVELLGYSRRTAARRVQQARAAGLLPETTQGKKRAE